MTQRELPTPEALYDADLQGTEAVLADERRRIEPHHFIVALGLPQHALQTVHGLSWMGLLGDEDAEQRVRHVQQDTFGAAAPLAVASLPLPGLVWRGAYGIRCRTNLQ